MQERVFSQPDRTEYSQDAVNRQKRNGGYAMVLVIVAIALATILVSVLMSISLLNYQMKVTEYNAKDNFYSAEIVMDQIHAGLEQEVSNAAGTAYAKTIQTYGTAGSTEESRVTSFRENYIVNLRNALRDVPTSDDTKYYIGGESAELDATTGVYTAGLMSYLDKNLAQMYKDNKDNVRKTNIINVVSADGNCTMTTTASGIVLKGLKVTYVDANGFYSEIQTDIHIGYPDVQLQEASVIPNVFEYSFIADEGVVNEANTATINDSIYAGKDGFLVKTGTSLAFDGAKYVVSKGNIKLEKGSALDFFDGEIWANGIDVNGGSLNKGTVTAGMVKQPEADYYIADDLTINQKNSYVSLSGNYYGFSGDIDGAVGSDNRNQSAIIVNGSHLTLRMTDLDKLLLGGNAYIGTGNSEEVKFVESEENASLGLTGGNNKNVLMGNSLAVKTDQIVFLAPAECLGTSGGQTLVGRNPMTATEYQKWMYAYNNASDPDYKLLDESKNVKLLGKPLSEYFGGDTGVHYQTVFQTINGESICYVYLKMTEDQAAVYYRDYVAAAEDKMKQYASKYHNNILVSDYYTGISSRGNLYSFDGSKNSLQIIPNTMTEGSDELQAFFEDRAQFQQNYRALCSKLTTNYSSLSEAEKNFTVYSNLINATALAALGEGGKAEYAADGNKALVIHNTESFTVNQSSDHIKLLIASGDVVVQGNFSGLIISGGTVTLGNYSGATISADKPAVTKLLQSKPVDGSDTKSLIETFFINGNRYVFSNDATGGSSSVVNLADAIAFRNWTKQ